MLVPGSRVGPYEITALLGEGGMGQVYRARDSKLGRDVAIKILPDDLLHDPDRASRFQREAHVLASLNHSNIAHVYGLESTETGHALVMELVEGETLAERIAHGPMPPDEVLPIARQMAEALEAAHERGVIHRDLKPANIKVRADGVVKVLDFGLAKLADADGSIRLQPDLSRSPTITSPAMITGAGFILGTAAYMAPEQARGKAVDKRADIWAFGCVLYEMLTGRRAFSGDSVTDTLAAVVMKDPDLSLFPRATPAAIRTLVRRCLEKDRTRRLPDIGAARIEVEEAVVAPSASVASAAPGPPTRPWLAWSAVAVSGVVAVTVAVVHFREPSPAPAQPMRFEMAFPANTRPAPRSVSALSPDGRQLAIIATAADGQRRLFIRSLDAMEATPLAGTEGAGGSPFWSPDSRFVAYLDLKATSSPKLRKIDSAGGPAQVISDLPVPPVGGLPLMRGGFWTDSGEIVFPMVGGGLYRVPAMGGVPIALTARTDDGAHLYPTPLPDGRHFLYVRGESSDRRVGVGGIFVGSLDNGANNPPIRLLPDRSNVAYVASPSSKTGFLLFVREGTLMAQPFDPVRLALTGEPQPVAERIGWADPDSFAIFSAAGNGIVVYQSEGYFRRQRLAWVDRRGETIDRVGELGMYGSRSISADGNHVAYVYRDGQRSDLWLLDLARGSSSPFTTNGNSWNATWFPDSSRIYFASNKEGITKLYKKSIGTTGEELVLADGVPLDWSSDGRFLLFVHAADLWASSNSGGSGPSTPVQLTQTKFIETAARFSPDSHWVAFHSDESGRNEVYVSAWDVSSTGGSLAPKKTQVSVGGGATPRWREDGRELFYVSADQKMMAVSVTAAGVFQAGVPRELFTIPAAGDWDVTGDGGRFLFTVDEGPTTPPPFTVLLNWQAGLRK